MQITPATPVTTITTVFTLPAFLAQVEAGFPKLIGAEAERQAITSKRIAKEGAFNPQISFSTDTLRFNSASSRGKASNTSSTDIGIEATTLYGFKLAAGRLFNTGTVKSPSSSTGSDGTYFLYLKAPLSRGAGINEKQTQLEQARLGEPIATQNIALLRQEILEEAAFSYWYWVGTIQKREIATKLLEVSEFRAKAITREIEEKQRPSIDGIEAQSEVERRRAGRIKSERDVEAARLKLGKFMWEVSTQSHSFSTQSQSFSTQIQSLSAPALPVPTLLPEDKMAVALMIALEKRPERKIVELQKQSIGLDQRLAQNDLKPNIDIIFSPGRDLGSQSIGETLKLGVTASIPLYQQDAKGRLSEAEQKVNKLTQEAKLIERMIEIEVADAISALRQTYARYIAAEAAYQQNLQLEKGELIRFKEGDSTLFLVNQRERATAEAAISVADIQVEYEQARASFRAATMNF